MTSGERMVLATTYAVKRDMGKSVVEAFRLGVLEVKNLRSLAVHAASVGCDADDVAMLRDMLGTGADR